MKIFAQLGKKIGTKLRTKSGVLIGRWVNFDINFEGMLQYDLYCPILVGSVDNFGKRYE